MAQIVVTGGMILFLAFQNTQEAVGSLKTQLRKELAKRIQEELTQYFSIPHNINQLNAAAYRRGEIDVLAATGEAQLYQQLQQFPNISFAYCGSDRNGEFFGVLHDPSDSTHPYQLSFSNPATQSFRHYYSLDKAGDRIELIRTIKDKKYFADLRPWFDAAESRRDAVWSDVYIAFTTELPNITASLPVYADNGSLIGVCATDVVLSEEFRQFMQDLDIGGTGKAIVLDRRTGELITDSTDTPLFIEQDNKLQLRLALDSEDPLIAQTTNELMTIFGDLANINDESIAAITDTNNETLEFVNDHNNKRQVLEVLPFIDDRGLDWLIVVVVPQESFMESLWVNIQTGNQKTWWACGIALAISTWIAMGVARSVAEPILAINEAAKELTAGNWNKRVPLKRQDEIGELAVSFNEMADQIKSSFAALEAQKDSFARFFPPEYLHFLGKSDVTEVVLGEHVSKEMAVMFSDIRDFTTLAETLTPQASFDFINSYLRHVTPEISAHNGFVVKFLGDGLMAVFPGTADDAVSAGIAKCEKIQDFNSIRATQGYSSIAAGIGIHIGHMMVGMIGDQKRLQADALSDCVNLSARLEGLTKIYDVPLLISAEVVNRLQHPKHYEIRLLDRVIVKGRKEAIAIHEVLDAENPFVRELKIKTRDAFHQAVEYYRLGYFKQAKQIFEEVWSQNPTDKTTKIYIDRLTDLLKHGPREEWSGVWMFKHK
ncbi:MAG: adenylate/guanylate cyclase domain-containing protein [Cyanobacteria bacterium P01_F01_bin.150]